MKIPPLSQLVLLICIGWIAPVHAEKADRNQPMIIDADTLRYDDVKQVSIFTGNVVLTKGSIVIRAARIDVRQDPNGYQFGTITGATDKPAFFRQKREGLDEFIEGQSELIEYDGRADTVKFVKNALLRRLRGANLADEFTGALIVYENLTDMFSVDGSAVKGGVTGSGGRVRAMLTPKPEAAATAPKIAASTPVGAALRATTTLGPAAK